MKKLSAKQMAISSVLIAMALALSYVERFFPLEMIIPLPGIKLGLANIVTMFALCFLGFKTAMSILLCRCLLGSIFGGGISGLMFSLTGGIFAMLLMAICRKIKALSLYGVSVCGSAAHVTGQIIAASIMLKSWYVFSYLPILLVSSIFTGLLTGSVSSALFSMIVKSKALEKYI